MMNLAEKVRSIYANVCSSVKKGANLSLLATSLLVPSFDNLADAQQRPRDEVRYILGLHGIDQTWNQWKDLEHLLERQYGFEVVGINLPNKGLNGWEQNEATLDEHIAQIAGPVHAIFGYSLGGVTWLRYLAENPEILEKNKGGTLVLLDPATKSSLGEFVMSDTPVQTVALSIFKKRISPSQTDLELTRKDNGKFLENVYGGLDRLAENLRKNNWKVRIISLNSEAVDGSSHVDVVNKLKGVGVDAALSTPDEVMNAHSLPTVGNRGIRPGGKDVLWATTVEHVRKSAVHAWWSGNFRLGLFKFIETLLQPQGTEGMLLEQPIQPRYVSPPADADLDKKYIGKDDFDGGKPGFGKPSAQDTGGIDLGNITLRYITEGSANKNQYFGYVFKGRPSQWFSGRIDSACKVSLDAFLNSLTLPDEVFWVNLNPDEPKRVIDERLRRTAIGEIMLRADLNFKKEFAKVTDPRTSPVGKEFWESLRNIGGANVQVSSRIWAVPGVIEVYANKEEVYIKEAKIKVLPESKYLSQEYGAGDKSEESNRAQDLVERLVIPAISKAVNEGEEFDDLRQVFHARILAQGYKEKFSTAGLFSNQMPHRSQQGLYAIEGNREFDPRKLFDEYVKSYSKGEYSFPETERRGGVTVTRTYFMGGIDFTTIKYTTVGDQIPNDVTRSLFRSMFDPLGCQDEEVYYLGGILVSNERIVSNERKKVVPHGWMWLPLSLLALSAIFGYKKITQRKRKF